MRPYRQLQTLLDDRMIQGSADGISAGVDPLGLRNSVLIDVLRKLPEEDYGTLRQRRVWLFVPDERVWGWNGPLPQDKSQIIYLPASLEKETRKDCLLLIAHEIAHCVLNHVETRSENKEGEAWDKVQKLGFGTAEEIRAFRAARGQLRF